MYGSLLPKANGGGDRRDYAHSKRAIQRILSSVFTVTRWQGDTSFSTFRLARGQAGKIRPKVPACPRESKSSEFPVTSVTLSPRSRLLPRRKSKTYDAKVSYLRYESQLLTIWKSGTYDAKVSSLRCISSYSLKYFAKHDVHHSFEQNLGIEPPGSVFQVVEVKT